MPFLFVDYDQGAGGEFFCSKLSQSEQCVSLQYTIYPNSRTKIFDRFDQKFLMDPMPQITPIISDSVLFELVPTHRHINMAYKLLSDVRSIRITSPEINSPLWIYFKQQQISKVLLTREPTGPLLVGLLKKLVNSTSNTEFLKKIKSSMDTLSLILLSEGIEPTESNKNDYINTLVSTYQPEPEFNYDLIIKYSDLLYNTQLVKIKLQEVFGITVIDDWLETYQKNYEAFLSQT
jgi:hypothetical protein